MALTPGTRLGHYEIAGPLGAGGMGEVYRARDTRLQRPAAIKILGADKNDTDRLKRLEREALSASALNHPNILTVYDFGDADGLHYIATELVDGETLRQRIERGALPIAKALDIASQIAAALAAAHAAGIVHRDIKPENVMLRPDGFVKVLDFGVAKLVPTSEAATDHATLTMQTVPGTLIGTVGYMAPEQVRGMPVDGRADIWSLGVVLHEMLTGRSPFRGPTTSDVIAAVLARTPPSLASAGVEARPELERVIAKALAKDREARYQAIAEFASDLRLIAETDRYTSGAGGPSPVSPTSRRIRRAILALLALFAIASLTWTAWTLSRRPNGGTTLPAETPDPAAAAPMYSFTYWLTVQPAAEDGTAIGQAFPSAGDEVLEASTWIALNFTNPRTGYVYVLNEDRGPSGEPRLTVLYPTPSRQSGSAEVPAGEIVTTGRYLVGGKPVEQLWVVWSQSPHPLLEKAKRFVTEADLGVIKTPDETAAVLNLLQTSGNDTSTRRDADTKRTIVSGSREPLVHLTQLRTRGGRT